MLTLALLVAGLGGVNAAMAETIVTKTPVILSGGQFAECFVPGSGTYAIQMQGWQSFIAYENAEGLAFDENSTMVFDLAENVSNTSVRVTFSFFDSTNTTNKQFWQLLGIGNSIEDNSIHWGNAFDNSTYFLKKAFGDDFETLKSQKITKVTVDNFNYSVDNVAQLVTYKVNGGTICGQPMTIKNANAKTFGAYGGVFTATTEQSNIFKMQNFEVGDYQKVVIKFGEPVPATGNWAYNYQSNVWPPSIPVGVTELEIPLDGTTLPELTIFNWNANPDPINISEVYLYKEEAAEVLLTFNDYGFATSNKKDLVANGGLSYNPSTGVLTSDGTAGTLTLEFTDPVNLEDLNTFDVKRSGNSNIVNRLRFYDSENNLINTWNNAKWYNSGLDYNATNAFKTHNDVKKLVWEADENADNDGATLTITGIEWQLKTISATKGTDIRTLPYKEWSADGDNDATVVGDATPQQNIGFVTGNVVYGSDAISASKKYVDLTNYKKLIVRGYGNIRLFYNWQESPQDKPEISLTNNTTTPKTMELDIPAFMAEKGISHFHLVGIKTNWGAELFVESISVLDGTEKYDYSFSGRGGLKLQTAIDALADETATAIDATGLTNDTRLKETLTTANPNCLIFVNSDQLTNESNVVVDGTCANLALTDGKSFKSPVAFTATAAPTYSRAFTAGMITTICLPFALTSAEASSLGTIYELNSLEGTTMHFTPVEATEANKAYLLMPAATSLALSETGKSISATPANLGTTVSNIDFIGTLAPTEIPASSEEADGYTYYAYNNGQFVRIVTNAATLPAFRGYFKVQNSGVNARALTISLDNETTGITDVKGKTEVESGEVYDLSGRRVVNPIKGMYIVNGKKVIK